MTRILALETAGETCSVALMDGGRVLEHFEQAPRRQTERVLPMVEAVLAESQLKLRQLDGIAFGHGPGAFTGVRVAAAVTQGLAFAADLPVIGISTLAACALSAQTETPHAHVIATFDARMGEVYLGAYQCHDNFARPVFADGLFRPDALPELPKQDWMIVGSGLVYQEQLVDAYGASRCVADVHPHAKAVAQLALSGFERGEGVSADQAQPVYLRDQVIQGAVR
ncbi:MAG: tRNA (adenosine(37)-N6)-threonylcarbamoyltransferase complex dimerization subunit type 1 TsaB [Pseudomonadales bacterium]|nr:tRNA (adenosine(37)-N6)-threonylcarbamoyltransferase complex dimerization subunit type 1 TsaB [Pseudomonadales bacterium]